MAPHGRPSLMYRLPHLYGAEDQLCPVTDEKVQLCQQACVFKGDHPCDSDIFELCCILMTEKEMSSPHSGEDAVVVYERLRREIRDTINAL